MPRPSAKRHKDGPFGAGHHCQRRAPRFVIARPQRGRGALSAKREEVPLGCNLAVPGRITGYFRQNRDCLPEIATAPLGPRNDKPLAFTVLSPAGSNRQYSAGRGMPLPYNARLEIGVLFILKSSVFIIHLFLHAPPLQRTTDSPAISLKIIQNSIILEATAPCRTIFTRK